MLEIEREQGGNARTKELAGKIKARLYVSIFAYMLSFNFVAPVVYVLSVCVLLFVIHVRKRALLTIAQCQLHCRYNSV